MLEQAARAGVRRAVIASSLAISGLPFAATRRLPAYLPIDEELPLLIEKLKPGERHDIGGVAVHLASGPHLCRGGQDAEDSAQYCGRAVDDKPARRDGRRK